MNTFNIINTPLFLSYSDLVKSLEKDLELKIFNQFHINCKFKNLLVQDNTLYLNIWSPYESEDQGEEITKDVKYIELFTAIKDLSRWAYEES